jgi:hypothetical protein
MVTGYWLLVNGYWFQVSGFRALSDGGGAEPKPTEVLVAG